MMQFCEKCKRFYDDAQRWTICPHSPLGRPVNDLCPKCDTLRSVHGPCEHQMASDAANVAADALMNRIVRDEGILPKFSDMSTDFLRLYLNTLAGMIEDFMPPGPNKKGRAMFVIAIVDDTKVARYVANVERPDGIQILRDTADAIEQSMKDGFGPMHSDYRAHVEPENQKNGRTAGKDASVSDVRGPDTDARTDGNGSQGGAGSG